MLQQRMIKRFHDDDHYANAIFQYAREYAVSIRDICSFVCTDDKHKISMSEPNFPLRQFHVEDESLMEITKAFKYVIMISQLFP